MKVALVIAALAALPLLSARVSAGPRLDDAQLDAVSAGYCIANVCCGTCAGPAPPGYASPMVSGLTWTAPASGFGTSVANVPGFAPAPSVDWAALLSGGSFSARASADAIGRI
jgi:hypothetical protein